MSHFFCCFGPKSNLPFNLMGGGGVVRSDCLPTAYLEKSSEGAKVLFTSERCILFGDVVRINRDVQTSQSHPSFFGCTETAVVLLHQNISHESVQIVLAFWLCQIAVGIPQTQKQIYVRCC